MSHLQPEVHTQDADWIRPVLKQALEILGYGHVYHVFEAVFENTRDQEMGMEALQAKYKLWGRDIHARGLGQAAGPLPRGNRRVQFLLRVGADRGALRGLGGADGARFGCVTEVHRHYTVRSHQDTS